MRVKSNQSSCYLRPSFLWTPLVPSRRICPMDLRRDSPTDLVNMRCGEVFLSARLPMRTVAMNAQRGSLDIHVANLASSGARFPFQRGNKKMQYAASSLMFYFDVEMRIRNMLRSLQRIFTLASSGAQSSAPSHAHLLGVSWVALLV